MIFRNWNLNAQWAHCYWDTGLPAPPSRQRYSNYTYTYTSMLNCLFFCKFTARATLQLGSRLWLLRSPISLLCQYLHYSQFHPHFYSASLHLVSSQSVALRLALAQLAPQTGCCQPASPHTQPAPARFAHPPLWACPVTLAPPANQGLRGRA